MCWCHRTDRPVRSSTGVVQLIYDSNKRWIVYPARRTIYVRVVHRQYRCAGSINKQWTVIYFSTSVTLNLNIDTDTKSKYNKRERKKKNTIKYFTGSSDKFDPLQCTYLYCRWYNTEQRKLALYVVALVRCRWGHNESWRESLCTCMVLRCRCGHNESWRESLCTCMVLRCRCGHKGYCAVMHNDKGVDERTATRLYRTVAWIYLKSRALLKGR